MHLCDVVDVHVIAVCAIELCAEHGAHHHAVRAVGDVSGVGDELVGADHEGGLDVDEVEMGLFLGHEAEAVVEGEDLAVLIGDAGDLPRALWVGDVVVRWRSLVEVQGGVRWGIDLQVQTLCDSGKSAESSSTGTKATIEEVMTTRLTVSALAAEVMMLMVPLMAGLIMSFS